MNAPAFVVALQQPFLIGGHRSEGMPALDFGIGFLEPDAVALPDVALVGAQQEAAEQIQRQRVALHVVDQCPELLLRAAFLSYA